MEGVNIDLMDEVPELPLDIICETENTATIKTNMFDEGMDIELTIMGVDHIMLDDTEYFRITKDELEKTLKYLGETDAGYHELGIPTGVSDIASEIMYEYIYVPYGIEARYKPDPLKKLGKKDYT